MHLRRGWPDRPGSRLRLRIPEQYRQPARAVHAAFHQQFIGQAGKLRVMLEVFAGGLHRVDGVRGGEGLAVKAGHADQ